MDVDTLSSLSSLSSFCAPEETPAPAITGGGDCALEEFDSKRSKELSQSIWEYQKQVNGGKVTGQVAPDRLDNIESVQRRQQLIGSMAISGGASPEKYEAAALMPVGTQRRTTTGIYQVGWDWNPSSNCGYPKKKWFPVTYRPTPLPLAFRMYKGCQWGIPSICPLRWRYGYLSPFGPVKEAPKKEDENKTAESTAAEESANKAAQNNAAEKPASVGGGYQARETPVEVQPVHVEGGGMHGGPFGNPGNTESNSASIGGGVKLVLHLDMQKAIAHANEHINFGKVNPCAQEIHDKVKWCAQNLTRWFPNPHKCCNTILQAIRELKTCPNGPHKNYVKACINVCLLKLKEKNKCKEIAGALRQALEHA